MRNAECGEINPKLQIPNPNKIPIEENPKARRSRSQLRLAIVSVLIENEDEDEDEDEDHGRKWLPGMDSHHHGSQTLDLRGLLFPLNHSPESMKWILQPVLPRQDFFTKEIRSLLHGGDIKPQIPTSKFQKSSNIQAPKPLRRAV